MNNQMRITFLGSGDNFGSGGRFQTCILVRGNSTSFLLDCGASSLIAMRRFGINPGDIDLILLSHLHGDHFGGIPFYILDAQLISKRTRPLVIAGPPETRERLTAAMEALYPGSSRVKQKFALEIIGMDPGQPQSFNEITVTPYAVRHHSGDTPLALRVECGGKTIAYSGDTEWTDSLVPAAREADLFIAECYYYEKKIPYHLDYRTLMANIGRIRPRRTILHHMSQDMLDRLDEISCEHAEDGMVVEI